MLKIIDRYLLRELALPFLLTLVGFLIFILLFLLGQFSRLMIERIIPPGALMLLLLYKLPYLLVLALPVATLFAIFLALGRLGHDREIIALMAGGFSPRRLLLPLLIVGLLLSGVDFWLGDRVAPWGERQYWRLFLQQYYGARSTPQIRDHAFFKGAEERFFYVRRYDKERALLEGVLIYDLTGELALEEGRFPKVITAERATWEGEAWVLQDGSLHAFDDEGNLRYVDHFETMTINIGETIQSLTFEQRTPSEMSLGELARRIADFQRIGRPAESLMVDYHLKIAIPLACFVFALFGAPLSLLIGPRGRALGVILAVLLVLLYQGVLFWTAQVLAKRGDLPPIWGAWLPNLLFGLVGLGLVLRADHLGRIDWIERLKRFVPLLLTAIIAAVGMAGFAQEEGEHNIPIEISADSLTVSKDWREILAQGGVLARYAEGSIEAERLALLRLAEDRWELSARRARFENEKISGSAAGLRALLIEQDGRIFPQEIVLTQSASVKLRDERLRAERLLLRRVGGAWEVEAEAFSGSTDFVNARGETHRLRFQGRKARLTFDGESKLRLIDITDGDFTTCSCEAEIPKAAYSIRAGRLLIRPDELLMALNITLRAFGVPVFWAPGYLAPLGDVQQKYPFIPQVGRSLDGGWFAKWRIPFSWGEKNFGFLLLDYYSRYSEVGSGLDLNYLALPGSKGGRLSFYRLVGRRESLALDWSEHLQLNSSTRLDLMAALRTGALVEQPLRLLSGGVLSGSEGEWSWRVSLSRDENLLGPKPDPELLKKLSFRVLERWPELSLTKGPARLGGLPLSYALALNWGRYREEALDGGSKESSRFDGRVEAQLEPLEPLAGVRLSAESSYRLSLYALDRRNAWEFHPQLGLAPLERLSLTVDHLYRRVQGRSPFRFDRLAVSNRAAIRAIWDFGPWGNARLSTGYDAIKQLFDPLSLGFNCRLGLVGASLNITYDLNAQALKRVTLQGDLRHESGRLTLSGGYDFGRARYEDLIVKLDLGAPFRMGLRVDPNRLALLRLNLESRWQLKSWEFLFDGEYDLRLGRLSALRFGIVKKFCHACWQIGLYGTPNELWIQARINAFPTAEIGYSPTDRELSFGR